MVFVIGFIKIVSDGSGGGFVDNVKDVEIGNYIGIFGGLVLVVVEVGGNGNNGVGDFFVEIVFSSFFYFVENYGGNFFGGEGFVFIIDFDGDGWFVIFGDDFVNVS